MSQDETEKEEKVRYAVPLGGEPPLYVDSELSDEETTKFASKLREQANMLRGIMMGLLLGILGNLFVSHYYAAYAASITYLFGAEWLNLSNLVAIIVYVISFFFFGWFMYSAIKGLEDTSTRLDAHVLRKKKVKGDDKNERNHQS